LHQRRQHPAAWGRKSIALVKRRWSSGVSATAIARELGGRFSRDAVLGKIRRLGLVGAQKPDPAPYARRSFDSAASVRLIAGEDRAQARRRRSPHPSWITDAKPYVDDPGADADTPPAQRRALLELDGQSCRWPVGDPACAGFFFCGAEPLLGMPYCAIHCARAYGGLMHRAQEKRR
jgi:GcrA cell cycle regulator